MGQIIKMLPIMNLLFTLYKEYLKQNGYENIIL